ncbi:MAG: hypothetical protein R3C19_12040 [Planctomycetaceae bacterium]
MFLRLVILTAVIEVVAVHSPLAPSAAGFQGSDGETNSRVAVRDSGSFDRSPGDSGQAADDDFGRTSWDAILLLDDRPYHLRFRVLLQGRSLSEAREQCVQDLARRLDTDGNGELSRDEVDRSPLIRRKQRPKAAAFLESLGSQPSVDRDEIRSQVIRAAGEIIALRGEDSTAENDTSIFDLLDADQSGLLDSEEMQAAGNRLMLRDADNDQCVSFREFVPAEENPNPLAVNFVADDEPPQVTRSSLLMRAEDVNLRRELTRKYDADRDRRLSAGELKWSDERIALLDGDHDGRLNYAELRQLHLTIPDVELEVELTGPAEQQPAIRVVSVLGEVVNAVQRPDLVRVRSAGVMLTLAFRMVNPQEAAIENAMQGFNRLDADANGYLDETEVGQRIRFANGLFEMIDTDGDAKIFGEEMKAYVTVAGAPFESTCQVNVYDTGYGFFQTMDVNNDGRLSLREMRTIEESLMSMERDGQEGLSPGEPTRNYYVEFVRGSFSLFGPRNSLVSQSPEFTQRAAFGPIWFQRMDRNNDGDLTWDEFLGYRLDFDRLDKDHDGLIDPDEAAAAGAE